MNTDTRLELKSFVFQVEQMRMAQARYNEIEERLKLYGTPEDLKAKFDIAEIRRQLEINVDASIKEFNKRSEMRIAPEQLDADQQFRTSLDASLHQWREELAKVQAQQIDQAISDSRAGGKSEVYAKLEEREKELMRMIREAEEKLGKVQERIQSPAFNGVVNQIINNAKP